MLPQSRIGRPLAVGWLLACVAVLVFGYEQKVVHDMPEVFILFMAILSFPLGFLVLPVTAMAWAALVGVVGSTYVAFRNELPLWLAAVALGYWQWFVVLPQITSWLRSRRERGDA